MNEGKSKNANQAPVQLDNFSDLLGKKSVRATLWLRPEVISVLRILSTQLGIKQKSLFDFLMEDMKALHSIAKSLAPGRLDKDKRIRKTLVVSHKSLSTLQKVAEQFSVSRDDIVELLIQRLLPVFEKEHRQQGNRERAVAKIREHFNQRKPLMDEIRRLVGEQDSLYRSFQAAMDAYAKAFAEIETVVDKGNLIYKFPIEFIKRDA